MDPSSRTLSVLEAAAIVGVASTFAMNGLARTFPDIVGDSSLSLALLVAAVPLGCVAGWCLYRAKRVFAYLGLIETVRRHVPGWLVFAGIAVWAFSITSALWFRIYAEPSGVPTRHGDLAVLSQRGEVLRQLTDQEYRRLRGQLLGDASALVAILYVVSAWSFRLYRETSRAGDTAHPGVA